ncbi:hypothetical protein J2Q11_11615 [Tenacibaculum finnmarkense genomovar finnmarkense]|uniref:DUF2116 family Zn-ribbon domain-containing protein n=1 Tax=Tenacibaculum finnmarkense genomovar finnmarkense TaxID=1458503 RepID=A0AAP1WGV2_9FLAO|nr:hypothetical protein [Tenacibaculum finnmarkense]MBE7653463.1 hypothetical protein [Tenacibaculum finnmarkense genomovar finnmarkense]MBE7661236.1 hypothetical protein [Tenacibaculum finnmarkense genomovar finnmarkense]MBE7695767.1 hypothetical protein [Tenacibaculum finnmarkense genomovar finnmarkense]MCD8413225.1 hypothetical protein [Tenacibaculum finnmarkense genomovar ulcerans]MCD8418427.1 hypothetical protein [Tenacibaculum finnmarkense genomovar finnmarkense]
MEKKCLHCKNKLEGRVDKKYCSSYCRSSYHYENNKEQEDSLFSVIDKKLKNNRKILKEFNKAGYASVRKEKLLAKDFDPNYFTNYWKNSKGQVYLFCYEYGFLAQREKYILVHWQSYMKPK